MKKYLLAAVLVLASASAMADRTVSGVTTWNVGSFNNQNSKASACESAKITASQKAKYDEKVEEYSKCECEKDGDRWSCSVDAKLEKTK